MKLYIGNKNYSSWSLRVWLALRVKNIPFEEALRPFDVENDYADFFEFSPSGKVPVLHSDGQAIWESLSILEFVAEKYPDRGLWPMDVKIRSKARSIAHEMHGGFMSLRSACPMNIRRRVESIDVGAGVLKDVRRVEQIWEDCLTESGGPFLFGDFSIADSMYAPIVNRLEVYELSQADSVLKFSEAIKSLPAWDQWVEAAVAEEWVVDIDEVYRP
ncbi:MAG: glutathione S-transferase family protein [Pseudomonadota bacterium]